MTLQDIKRIKTEYELLISLAEQVFQTLCILDPKEFYFDKRRDTVDSIAIHDDVVTFNVSESDGCYYYFSFPTSYMVMSEGALEISVEEKKKEREQLEENKKQKVFSEQNKQKFQQYLKLKAEFEGTENE